MAQEWEHQGTWIMPQGFEGTLTAAAPAAAVSMPVQGDDSEDEEQLCVVRLPPPLLDSDLTRPLTCPHRLQIMTVQQQSVNVGDVVAPTISSTESCSL